MKSLFPFVSRAWRPWWVRLLIWPVRHHGSGGYFYEDAT